MHDFKTVEGRRAYQREYYQLNKERIREIYRLARERRAEHGDV